MFGFVLVKGEGLLSQFVSDTYKRVVQLKIKVQLA
jgi:hypothetical protein